MELADIEQLESLLTKVDSTPETICSTGQFMIEQSVKGYGKECVQIWKKHEEKTQDVIKKWLFYVAHECIQNHQKDQAVLLMAFGDLFGVSIANTIAHCPHGYVRDDIQKLINVWGQQQYYGPDFIQCLNDQINKAKADYPIKESIGSGISIKVKLFAVYYRNFQQCKTKADELKENLDKMIQNPGESAASLEAKIDKYSRTLLSLKVNRRNLLKSVCDLTKEFRQNIGLRLHKIQELEDLKAAIKELQTTSDSDMIVD